MGGESVLEGVEGDEKILRRFQVVGSLVEERVSCVVGGVGRGEADGQGKSK
jgi:hypothetical protein